MYLFFRRQASSLFAPHHCIRCRGQASRIAPNAALLRQPGMRTETLPMNAVRTDTHSLSGQVAVITGAGRGIGAAIARGLSDLGATAVLCGRTKATLEATAKSIAQSGGKAEAVACDVSSLESVDTAAKH